MIVTNLQPPIFMIWRCFLLTKTKEHFMKRHIAILTALLLSACGGPALPVREFLQDKQNDL